MLKYYKLFSLLLLASVLFTGCSKSGCTDIAATNYDADANKDDGSCLYDIHGCMDANSINYDSTATHDEGCSYVDQALVNTALTAAHLDVTGHSLNSTVPAHDGGITSTPDSTFRDIFSTLSSMTGTIAPGTVFTKNTYGMDGSGNKGSLNVSFAMVKRYAGYNPDGGDWEYMMIGFDSTNNYTTNPYGMIPATEDDMMRGKIPMCASCHGAAADGDYVFSND